MSETTAKLGEGGGVVIPAEYRRLLGLLPGDDVLLIMQEDGLLLTTRHFAIQRAQALVRRYIPEGRRLAEELVEERRREYQNV